MTSDGASAGPLHATESREVSRASAPALAGQRPVSRSNMPSKTADAIEISVPSSVGYIVETVTNMLPTVQRLIGAAFVGLLVAWQLPAPASATSSPVKMPHFPFSGGLVRKDRVSNVLDEAVLTSPLSAEERQTAYSAYQDAQLVLRDIPYVALPKGSVTEDGCISLLWNSSGRSVIMVFGGDGNVVFSIKEPGGKFGDNIRQFSVEDPVPGELKWEFSRIF
jgi:hypothetical protein